MWPSLPQMTKSRIPVTDPTKSGWKRKKPPLFLKRNWPKRKTAKLIKIPVNGRAKFADRADMIFPPYSFWASSSLLVLIVVIDFLIWLRFSLTAMMAYAA